MQINCSETQSFSGLRTSNGIMSRLDSPKRYIQYQKLVKQMEDCNIDCLLSQNENGRLSAKLSNGSGKELAEQKESVISALLNLTPIRFIKKMCKIATDMDSQVNKI